MGIGYMKKTPFATLMTTGMLAASLLLPVPPTCPDTSPTARDPAARDPTGGTARRARQDRFMGLARFSGLAGAHRPGAPSRGCAHLYGLT